MNPIIRVEKLSKLYHIGLAQERHDTLRDALVAGIRKLNPFKTAASRDRDRIWALKDVSFEVQQGEVLGVIGSNGAGKSTLLKILSRITEPTSGRAEIRGRVGSLLEVGTGFHPELTGRENIFLNGAILGMRRAEIERKFDEIVAFSEIEKFLDTPVKRYSSGMYVRLAFAVAAHLEPEVLLVDEVLAVGDAAFQKKCLGKMSEISGEGRTIVFVSHNMVALRKLCQTAIFLVHGEMAEMGEASKVVSSYLNSVNDDQRLMQVCWDQLQDAPGNAWIRVTRLHVRALTEEATNFVYADQGFEIGVDFRILMKSEPIEFIFTFLTSEEAIAFVASTIYDPYMRERTYLPGRYRVKCRVAPDLLNEGIYKIQTAVKMVNGSTLVVGKSLVFEVIDPGSMRQSWFGHRKGVFAPKTPWEIEEISPEGIAQTAR